MNHIFNKWIKNVDIVEYLWKIKYLMDWNGIIGCINDVFYEMIITIIILNLDMNLDMNIIYDVLNS